MFAADLLSLLRRWKDAGDEIVLMGDLNENLYSGPIASSLLSDDLRMLEVCLKMTGVVLPPTHL